MILRLHTERYLKYFWAFLGGAINSFLHLIRKLRQMDFAEVLICCYPYLLAASGRTVFPGQGSEMLISEKHSGIFLFFFFHFSKEGMPFLLVAMAELSTQT